MAHGWPWQVRGAVKSDANQFRLGSKRIGKLRTGGAKKPTNYSRSGSQVRLRTGQTLSCPQNYVVLVHCSGHCWSEHRLEQCSEHCSEHCSTMAGHGQPWFGMFGRSECSERSERSERSEHVGNVWNNVRGQHRSQPCAFGAKRLSWRLGGQSPP